MKDAGKSRALGLASDEDIDRIISGGYADTTGPEPGMAQDWEIDAIISGGPADALREGQPCRGPACQGVGRLVRVWAGLSGKLLQKRSGKAAWIDDDLDDRRAPQTSLGWVRGDGVTSFC